MDLQMTAFTGRSESVRVRVEASQFYFVTGTFFVGDESDDVEELDYDPSGGFVQPDNQGLSALCVCRYQPLFAEVAITYHSSEPQIPVTAGETVVLPMQAGELGAIVNPLSGGEDLPQLPIGEPGTAIDVSFTRHSSAPDDDVETWEIHIWPVPRAP